MHLRRACVLAPLGAHGETGRKRPRVQLCSAGLRQAPVTCSGAPSLSLGRASCLLASLPARNNRGLGLTPTPLSQS